MLNSILTNKENIMSGLLMKYFVLKPEGGDDYAHASRIAMETYASYIMGTNKKLALDLFDWIDRIQEDNAK